MIQLLYKAERLRIAAQASRSFPIWHELPPCALHTILPIGTKNMQARAVVTRTIPGSELVPEISVDGNTRRTEVDYERGQRCIRSALQYILSHDAAANRRHLRAHAPRSFDGRMGSPTD